MLRISRLPFFFCLAFGFANAPILLAQVELPRDFAVRSDESLRDLAARIRRTYGDANLKRFEFGLGEGIDARNGLARTRLVERNLLVRKPVSQRGGTAERPQAYLDFPIRAEVEVQAVDGSVRHLPFVLHDRYRIEKVRGQDRLLGFERLGTILSVTLPTPLREGETVRIEMEYVARVDLQRVSQGSTESGFCVRVLSDGPFVVARSSLAWYPSLRGQSVPGRLQVWAGRAWRAIGPGDIEDDRPNPEEGLIAFRMSRAQDPYFVVGDFEKLRVSRNGRWFEWVGPQDRVALGRALIDRAATSLEWFETLRASRADERATVAVPVPAPGGVALQIATLKSPWTATECWEAYFTPVDVVPNQDTITALLGRTWWWSLGKVRTGLDEALFTYLGRRHAIELEQRDDAGDWMTTGESGLYLRAALRHASELPSLRAVLQGKAGEPWLAAITLAGKGALFFRALVHEVGFDALVTAMNDVLLHTSGKRVEIAAWREFLERASGRDLDLAFSGWLDAVSLPQYALADVRSERDDEGALLRFTLRAGNHPVGLPIDVAIETVVGRERHQIVVEQASTDVRLRVKAAPRSVEIDPDFLLLRDPRTLGLPLHPADLAPRMARLTALVIVYDGKGPEEQVAFRREVAQQMGERLARSVHLAPRAELLPLEIAVSRGLPEHACVVLLGTTVTESMREALGLPMPSLSVDRCVQVHGHLVHADQPGFIWFGQRAGDERLYLAWTPLDASLTGPSLDQWVIYDGKLALLSGFDAPRNELRADVGSR